MFVANGKSPGAVAIALLVVAFVLIPALLIVSRPFSDSSLAVALICGVICTGLARRACLKANG